MVQTFFLGWWKLIALILAGFKDVPSACDICLKIEKIHCKISQITIYCEIIIVRWEQMFVAFVSNPYPRIYIPTNVNIDKHFFNIHLNFSKLATHKITYQKNQENFGYPWTLAPTNKSDSIKFTFSKMFPYMSL